MASHKLIENLNLDFIKDTCIVEIGSARETSGPESSTYFFSELSLRSESDFYSVDFSPQSYSLAKNVIGEKAFLSDGVKFLENFSSISDKKISILYLDNFDVIYNDKHKESLLRRVGSVYEDNEEEMTNERSSVVHLEQMKAALPLLNVKNIVIIDDTRKTDVGWWGKGALVVPYLLERGYKISSESEDGIMLEIIAKPKSVI
jgi:hypothetical protein